MSSVGLSMIVKEEPLERVALLVEYLRPVVSKFSIGVTEDNPEETIAAYSQWPGVVALPYAWHNDFAAARNSTLEHLTDVDWVLHLDADELISWDGLNSVKWISENAPKKVLGYRFFTKNFWGVEWGIEVPQHWHTRLFRQGRGKWYKKLHEQVELDGKKEDQARSLGILIDAPKKDYIIHAKPKDRLDKSAMLYKEMEGH